MAVDPSDPPERQEKLCTEPGQARECMDGEGTQFCDYLVVSELAWGECLLDFDCMPGETHTCEAGGSASCLLFDGVPSWESCPFTPLVLSFDPGAVIETAVSHAEFDLAGVGECLDSDWPSATNPWLAVDLDRNGFIDGGHELFGSGTILASGQHASHGFVALAPFDADHDGWITAADPRFSELLVWRDEDADKRSLPFELSSLSESGIRAIAVDYGVLESCDMLGNCGRERSRFEYVDGSGRVAIGEVVDLYLTCQ